MSAADSTPILAAALGTLTTVAGWFAYGTRSRFKSLEDEISKKQPKDFCKLEHTHIKETLDRIEKCVYRTGVEQQQILRSITRIQTELSIKEDDDDNH